MTTGVVTPTLDVTVWSPPRYNLDLGQLLAGPLPCLSIDALDENNDTGGGSIVIAADAPAVVAGLLTYGNVVKIADGGRVVASFEVTRIEPGWLDQQERVGRILTITGDGPPKWMDTAAVLGKTGYTPPAGSQPRPVTAQASWLGTIVPGERAFDFSAYDPPAAGSPFAAMSPGYLAGEVLGGNAPNGQTGYNRTPSSWPAAGHTQWVCGRPWQASSPFMNDCFGAWYFRAQFTVTDEGPWTVWAACDNAATLYIDGEQIADLSGGGSTSTTDVYLAPGQQHVIVARVVNYVSTVPFNPSVVALMIGKKVGDGAANMVLQSGYSGGSQFIIPHPGPTAKLTDSTGAVVWYREGSAVPPRYTFGDVLATLLDEAATRRVHGVQNMAAQRTFTAAADSAGQPWVPSNIAWRYDAPSTTIRDVIDSAVPLGLDWAVDPDTYRLDVWRGRGTDRRDTVQLPPGAPVDDRVSTEIAPATAAYLPSGQRLRVQTVKQATYGFGRREVTVQQVAGDRAMVTAQVNAFLDDASKPRSSSTYRYTSLAGLRPWVDFDVADIISRYDPDTGNVVASRVVSIAAHQSASGGDETAYWDVELDYPERPTGSVIADRVAALLGSGAVTLPGVRAGAIDEASGAWTDVFATNDEQANTNLLGYPAIPPGGVVDIPLSGIAATEILDIAIIGTVTADAVLRVYRSDRDRARDTTLTGQPRGMTPAEPLDPTLEIVAEAHLTSAGSAVLVTDVYGTFPFGDGEAIGWSSNATPPALGVPVRIINTGTSPGGIKGWYVRYRPLSV